MRAVKLLPLVAVAGAALILSGPAASAAPGARAASGVSAVLGARAAPGAPPGGGCSYVFVPPNSWLLECSNGGGGTGGPGGGGGGGRGGRGGNNLTCTTTLLTPAQIAFLGLPPPPAGEKWGVITCPGTQPFSGVTLVSANGTPAVTPQELLQVAIGELRVPVMAPGTAPPLGRDGLVGLPEWFWVSAAQWHPYTVTVSAGPVWAEVIATPSQLSFDPGGGLGGASCQGPGISYRAARAAGQTATPCSYTYTQSSALQPGGAYPASVTVTWVVTWTGSGGTGGTVNAGLQIADPISVRVAEGQALVTRR
jgi:hypothetical protein